MIGKFFDFKRLYKLRGLLATGQPEPLQHAGRIVKVLRDVVLPSKAGVCLIIWYYVYSDWFPGEKDFPSLAMEYFRSYFLIYLGCNAVGALLFFNWRRLPPGLVQWLAFTLGLLDGLFMAALTAVTGGFASVAFWIFPALIVLNALSIPLAVPQIVLNLLLSVFYAGAVLVTPYIGWVETPDPEVLANMVSEISHTAMAGGGRSDRGPGQRLPSAADTNTLRGTNATEAATLAKLNHAVWKSHVIEDNSAAEVSPEQLLVPVSMLWLLTMCCYGTQVLLERQRQAQIESAEFAAREGQLHSAGRLAAEFAHQIKNPLAIINNAAYSLRRSLNDPRGTAAQQIEIIQEEVARADKVITQIMGYAQLSEGRVERLRVAEEIKRAVEQIFPAGPDGVTVSKHLQGPFPPLLMQGSHLREILENLLLNAREAAGRGGQVSIRAQCRADQTVEITVEDNGPGIPVDRAGRIFEAYYTTKEKGTGLGLAIVKHNAELYGGNVRVESALGKGARFTVTLPPKSNPKPFAK